MEPYELTSQTLFYWIPHSSVLKWYRVLYTSMLTVFSRWIFVNSDVNFVAWHLHNTALLSTLTGMWLVTMSHFLSAPNKYFNSLANAFFQTALPSAFLFALSFPALYSPLDSPLTPGQLLYLHTFDATVVLCLLLDQALNAIVFEFNELSLVPLLCQVASLAGQYYIFWMNGNLYADQYMYSDAFLYLGYLGAEMLIVQVSNMIKFMVAAMFKP
jgi:hypothetical protein